MKCDEIEKFDATSNADRSAGIESRYAYDADEVDAAIAELKAMVTTDNSAVIARLEAENAELKSRLEDAKATAYAESVDAGMALRKTQRALWLARANRAKAEWGHWATIWFCNTSAVLNINKSSVSQNPYRCTIQRNAAIWRNMWNEVERKCRAKAEQYL